MGMFEKKEQLDNMMYGTYNKVANLIFNLSKNKDKVQENIQYKDKHKGEKCFILGTGPSLKNVDVSTFEDKIIFGVNYLYKSEISNKIVPTYYCLYDEVFYNERIAHTKEVINKFPNTKIFMRTKAIPGIKKANISIENISFQNTKLYQYKDVVEVDMTKNMTATYNVVLSCIQIAIYMGFKEIYLLGCDFNSFASLRPVHCYDDDSIVREISMGDELKFYSLVTYHHYALNKHANSKGVKIYNATPNSLLDAYERVQI